jgi:PAS domain S-box-containing protein
MLLAAPDGRILRVNRALCELTGRSAPELAGRALQELLHPNDRDADAAALAAMLEGRTQRLAAERRVLLAGGGTCVVRINLSLIRDTDGTPLHFVGQVEDVTERRRMVEALTLSEARYKGLVAHLPDSAVFLIDPDLRIVLAEGDKLTGAGYEPTDVEGKPLRDVLGDEAFAWLGPKYIAALEGESHSFDMRSPTTGAMYWVQIAPLRDELGRVIGAMAVARDVTARYEAERILKERARDLERSNAELEQFAYVASHDLSEPLRMVSSYLQLLRRRYHGTLDPDADAFIDYAVDGAARMRDLIDDLLTYSRAARDERPHGRVDTRATVVRVLDALVAHEGARQLQVKLGELPAVHGDEQQLGQLFQNLIGNAVKFVPADRTPRLRIGAVREGGMLRFSVADNGIGIEPEQGDRIFRMFQRLHSRDEYDGTGIGLAIAKKVVERHGGSIRAENGPDGGAQFSFTLPVAEDAA